MSRKVIEESKDIHNLNDDEEKVNEEKEEEEEVEE